MSEQEIDDLENSVPVGEESVPAGLPVVLGEANGQSESLPSGPSGDGVPADRDPQSGRFLRGNRLGHGSPLAGQAAKLRAALFRAIKAGDVQEIMAALIGKAKTGDTVAARIVLAYTLGEPVALDVIEKVEKLEAIYIRSKG